MKTKEKKGKKEKQSGVAFATRLLLLSLSCRLTGHASIQMITMLILEGDHFVGKFFFFTCSCKVFLQVFSLGQGELLRSIDRSIEKDKESGDQCYSHPPPAADGRGPRLAPEDLF